MPGPSRTPSERGAAPLAPVAAVASIAPALDPSGVARTLALQRSVGNATTARLLQRLPLET
jgi:hypothetical protein